MVSVTTLISNPTPSKEKNGSEDIARTSLKPLLGKVSFKDSLIILVTTTSQNKESHLHREKLGQLVPQLKRFSVSRKMGEKPK
jgi:hypothetical protein